MPNDTFSRVLKEEPLLVQTLQRLTELSIKNGRYKATYTESKHLPDGSEYPVGTFTVERAEADAGKTANDAVAQLYQTIEVWRAEDEAQRASEVAADTGFVDPITGAALPLPP